MNVVVSAIVDPWVTTFSFVVALAMRIQGEKNRQIAQIWCTFPANHSDLARKSGSMKAPMTPHWIQKVRHGRPALKVQRICICGTDSLTKSGKSTDSLMLLGKSYRFFEEIRRAQAYAQLPSSTWRETRPLPAFPHKKPGIHTK